MDKLENIQVFTFGDYLQAAMRTCTESSKNESYMVTGLLSEVGEVIGKVAKMIRDNYGVLTIGRKEQIVAELGDVCWMIAGYCWVNNSPIPFSKQYQTIKEIDEDTHLNNPGSEWNIANRANIYKHVTALAVVAGDFAKAKFMGDDGFEELAQVFLAIPVIAKLIGSSLQEVMQHNIDKLTDRFNREVISGDGDNR